MSQTSASEASKNNQKRTYQAVDGLRAISMCLIIVYHCFLVSEFLVGKEAFKRLVTEMPLAFRWIWHADKSVDIFFVISGFLISSMLFKEFKSNQTIDLKSFYWRRFLRLIPMYWLALAFFYPFLANNHNIWANLLYVNNFLPAHEMFMGWSWSLAVEEQFYFLFPLFVLWVSTSFPTQMVKVLIWLIISSLLVRIAFHLCYDEFSYKHPSQFMFANLEGFTFDYFGVIYDNLYTRYGALACGCLAGYLHVHHSQAVISYFQEKPWRGKVFLYVSVAVIVLQTAIPHYNPDIHFSPAFVFSYSSIHRHIFSVAITIIMLLSLYPVTWNNWVSRFLSMPFWGFIAKLTYSMYLFHLALVVAVAKNLHLVFGNLDNASVWYVLLVVWISIVVVLAISILVASATYFGFERPVMNMRRPAKFHA